MTVVVALKDDSGNIWMGADRQASSDDTKIKLAKPKVFPCFGFLLGYAGSMSGDRLYYNFEPTWMKDSGVDIDEYMQTVFLKELKEFYEDWWIDTSAEGDLSLLIGIQGNIYEHNASDMSMTLISDDFIAIGSGGSFAMGALYATPQATSPKARVEVAIEAANKFSPYCGEGLDIISDFR
jgi:ATP-dependent protease HslVU (ClpYQ) peptidase subunit